MNEFERIENYLNNTLSASERVDFEKVMGQNKDLKVQVLLHQQVNELLLDKFLLEEKQFMKDFMLQQPKPFAWKKYVGFGSAALLVAGLSMFLYQSPKKMQEFQPINNSSKEDNLPIVTSIPEIQNNPIVQKQLPSQKQHKIKELVVIPEDKTIHHHSVIIVHEKYETEKEKDTMLSEKPKIVIVQKQEIQKPTVSIIQKKEDEISKTEQTKIEIQKPVYSFSASMQGGFEFTLFDNQKPYYLRIISKKGEEIFSKQIENSEWWEGINNRGEKVATGYYILLIQFEGEKIIKGSMTILP